VGVRSTEKHWRTHADVGLLRIRLIWKLGAAQASRNCCFTEECELATIPVKRANRDQASELDTAKWPVLPTSILLLVQNASGYGVRWMGDYARL
jgi:hypothetical protein